MENNIQTKKCPHCQTDIPRKAIKCPNCQSQLKSLPSRHHILTFFIAVMVFWFTVSLITSFNDSLTGGSGGKKTSEPLLELQSMNCHREYDYFIIEGTVKNISEESLKNVEAVGGMYQENGEIVTSDSALIDFNPILSGQISSFKVMHTDNPAIKKCEVNFKELMGGTIYTKDSRVK
ncbi:MAG: FxLYD domain-containing protein [Minisyncoccales bacterium]